MSTVKFPTGGQDATTAQNITKARRTKKHNATGELATLSDKFAPIYTEVQHGVTAEYKVKEDALQGVEDHILRLQHALLVEQQRRVKQLKTVEENLHQTCATCVKQCKAQVEALKPDIPARLDGWHKRLDAGFVLLEEERKARMVVIQRERLKLLKTVDDFEKQLEIEKVERLHREMTMMQQVSQEVSELQDEFNVERGRREWTLGHERDENDRIDAMRDRPDEIFKSGMVARMVGATKNIRMETAVRLHAEQQFVAALDSYTKSLQTGLRMVNKPPPKVDYTLGLSG